MAFYYFALVVTVIAIWLMARFVASPFGAALRGTRDQARRMSALGHNVWLIRWITFVYAGFWGAVSGLLYVYYHKYIHPASLSLHELGRRAARRDRRRLGHARRTDRRRGDRDGPQELRVGVHRALEHAARVRVRRDRAVHARRLVPGLRRLWARWTDGKR